LKRNNGYHLDYLERSPNDIKENPPIIILPSKEQDYTDDYFKAVFPKTVRLLQESKALVIIGYSLPEEDALMRYIIKQFAESPRDAKDKMIFYVDKMEEKKQEEILKSTFPYFSIKYYRNLIPYSGDFGVWVKNCLELLNA